MGLNNRDLALPKERERLLEKALLDLKSDSNVLGIYEGGSLARGDYDLYSDIDLHIIVKPDAKLAFIKNKKKRAARWGKVLFYEGQEHTPVIVTHYETFLKLDSWYHEPSEVQPSIWLRDIKAYYDPEQIIEKVLTESQKIEFHVTPEEITFWRTKIFAFVHETYRATMRKELYYALSNLDAVRWLIASGWYTEKDLFLFSPYLTWSKIERENSPLSKEQLHLLASWDCDRDAKKIRTTLASIYQEFLRLNHVLSKKASIDEERDICEKVFSLIR